MRHIILEHSTKNQQPDMKQKHMHTRSLLNGLLAREVRRTLSGVTNKYLSTNPWKLKKSGLTIWRSTP